MTTLIRERRGGKVRKCTAACYDASTPTYRCRCICERTMHGKGVSGLFGEDVPRKPKNPRKRPIQPRQRALPFGRLTSATRTPPMADGAARGLSVDSGGTLL